MPLVYVVASEQAGEVTGRTGSDTFSGVRQVTHRDPGRRVLQPKLAPIKISQEEARVFEGLSHYA